MVNILGLMNRPCRAQHLFSMPNPGLKPWADKDSPLQGSHFVVLSLIK